MLDIVSWVQLLKHRNVELESNHGTFNEYDIVSNAFYPSSPGIPVTLMLILNDFFFYVRDFIDCRNNT